MGFLSSYPWLQMAAVAYHHSVCGLRLLRDLEEQHDLAPWLSYFPKQQNNLKE